MLQFSACARNVSVDSDTNSDSTLCWVPAVIIDDSGCILIFPVASRVLQLRYASGRNIQSGSRSTSSCTDTSTDTGRGAGDCMVHERRYNGATAKTKTATQMNGWVPSRSSSRICSARTHCRWDCERGARSGPTLRIGARRGGTASGSSRTPARNRVARGLRAVRSRFLSPFYSWKSHKIKAGLT